MHTFPLRNVFRSLDSGPSEDEHMETFFRDQRLLELAHVKNFDAVKIVYITAHMTLGSATKKQTVNVSN